MPIGHVRNRGFFSNHWFENRLRLEPEWSELRDEARRVLYNLENLWKEQSGRVEHYGAEAPLEHAFIQPVFETLGWKLIYQTFLRRREPDYALFLEDTSLDAALKATRTAPDFWRHPTIVADAKAWHVPLNRPSIVNNRREYPPEQIEWYLDHSRLDYGILTNGKLWRLVPREYAPQQRRFQTYLECDLASLLESWRACRNLTEQSSLMDEFLEFYLFFSPVGYRKPETRKALIRRAIEGSSEYRVGVGEGLKKRAFHALRLCIEGFLTYEPNGLNAATDLGRCREESFILLYRLLFIMYAEDRRLLPYQTNRLYTENRSLRRHRDEIATRLDRIREDDEEDFSREETAIWEDLQGLFDLVNSGHRRYGVTAYNGGLFDPDAHPFLSHERISDYYLGRVIDRLGRAPDPREPRAGLFRVDYRDLAIQHLGAVYEGLLELHPHQARERMVVVSRRVQGRVVEDVWPAAKPRPKGYRLMDESYREGSIFLKTEKGERRASGSYYTPDHIVNHIVEETLRPLCKSVATRLEAEIREEGERLQNAQGEAREKHAARLQQLQSDFDDRILQLKILDPAMGSGHFLIRACQRLAEEIATHPYTGDEHVAQMAGDESTVSYWKRRVVENCLYGVDMNDLAVELAKLALWLETVAVDQPLSFLDHHLRHGNSLVGGKIEEMGVLPGEELYRGEFSAQVKEKLPALLEVVAAIRSVPSDAAEQIKEKDKLYRAFMRTCNPFQLVGNLWCSMFCGDAELTTQQYQKAIDELGRPRRFARVAREEWFPHALQKANEPFTRCFHWELEFPEVFFDGTAPRENPGFDAVIGNPPYDVLSELETGRDLTAFKTFIESQTTYDASRRGKNNLYKLFICRSLELLREGGYLGFITPMAVLGDDQAADIRRKMLDEGSFTGIEAFPQKDDPGRRVFPEAKLSTAVFTVHKHQTTGVASLPFISRVHPGQRIEVDSPSLRLTTGAIPLYDPKNFTIVSSSQQDWDLATRIMQTGRMTRLGQFAEFFQGEVNETNERKKGNLTDDPREGKLVTRGASICLYITRLASQGSDLYIKVDPFLEGRGEETKAYHFRYRRVGLQESSPQNNFRRVIACLIPTGHFCNHKVNYLLECASVQPLEFILGLLNSKLVDWYFRLGSTNAAVSHYQLYNLPCPVLATPPETADKKRQEKAIEALHAGQVVEAFDSLSPYVGEARCPFAFRAAIVEAVKIISQIEQERGEIARTERSALDPAAQPYQDLIDRLFYAMAGLTPEESAGLEERLREML